MMSNMTHAEPIEELDKNIMLTCCPLTGAQMALHCWHSALLHLYTLMQMCCRQKKEDTLPSTSAGISLTNDSHQDEEELLQKQALYSILSGLTRLFSADVLSSNVLSSMRDVQRSLQAQLKQQTS